MVKLPKGVRRDTGKGGLQRLAIKTEVVEAEIYLHGAHITHFQPRGQKPVLWVSEKSWFEKAKPIRGGIPICFPWFGARQDGREGPGHGFARLMEWDLTAIEAGSCGSMELELRLRSNEATRKQWEQDFKLVYRVQVGRSLNLEMTVENPNEFPIQIEEALHTYLAVSDARRVTVEGLKGTAYLDTVGTTRRKTQAEALIHFTEETDRIYLNTQSACVVHDPGFERRLTIKKDGSDTTVVWNPWIEKAKRMPDFGDEEWPGMLCVETCNVREHAVSLPPGESHTMEATIRAEPE